MRRAILVFGILTLAACSRNSSSNAKPQSTTAQAPAPAPAASVSATPPAAAVPGTPVTPAVPPKPVPAQLPEVVARVNGEAINRSDFENAVKGLEGRAGGPVPGDQRDQVYRGVLDDMIAYRLLIQEAKTRKIAVTDAEVDAQIGEIRKQFPDEAQFKQALAAQKLTLDAIRADTRSKIGVDKMMKAEIGDKGAVKPEEVADFYAKNPDKFKQPERVRASHILIAVPENADAAAKQQAKAKAEAILKDLKGGKDFAAAAKQNSQDPGSAVNGGDLGYFGQGQMVPPFEQAAFALKPGQMSDVVETPFGFHIIKMVDKQASRTVPLNEAKTQIEEYLGVQNQRTQLEAFVNSLKAKAKIEILI